MKQLIPATYFIRINFGSVGVLLSAISFDAQKILKVIHEHHAVLLCNDAL